MSINKRGIHRKQVLPFDAGFNCNRYDGVESESKPGRKLFNASVHEDHFGEDKEGSTSLFGFSTTPGIAYTRFVQKTRQNIVGKYDLA
jgi:hypothetical protein